MPPFPLRCSASPAQVWSKPRALLSSAMPKESSIIYPHTWCSQHDGHTCPLDTFPLSPVSPPASSAPSVASAVGPFSKFSVDRPRGVGGLRSAVASLLLKPMVVFFGNLSQPARASAAALEQQSRLAVPVTPYVRVSGGEMRKFEFICIFFWYIHFIIQTRSQPSQPNGYSSWKIENKWH